jgi:hypothetical protein
MGAGDDTAAHRLDLLHAYFLEHPVTGPTGTPRRRSSSPGTPVSLTTVDHIADAVREVTELTRDANSDAAPLPPRVGDVYAWCVENTLNTERALQQRRDTVIYRQQLEHAIAMGDTKVVRPHRCPACRTFGLMWPGDGDPRALCTNRRCLTSGGMSRRWTLARLAYEHVAEKYEKSVRDCAT